MASLHNTATGGADYAHPLTPTLPRWYFLMQFVASRLCSVSRHFLLHGAISSAQGFAVFMRDPLKKAKQ
jgi:hypothetical protein